MKNLALTCLLLLAACGVPPSEPGGARSELTAAPRGGDFECILDHGECVSTPGCPAHTTPSDDGCPSSKHCCLSGAPSAAAPASAGGDPAAAPLIDVECTIEGGDCFDGGSACPAGTKPANFSCWTTSQRCCLFF